MICISGTPGVGKSTVSRELRNMGYTVLGVHDIPGAGQCFEGEEADVECLDQHAGGLGASAIIEGHYSHLLGCQYVFILYREEDRIRTSLEARGYVAAKIEENLEAQRCDEFFSESLEQLPRGRIFRIIVIEGNPAAAAREIDSTIKTLMGNGQP